MEPIKTASRIHPLMAAAAVSVITVSIAGTAAITGLLPMSRGANAPAAATVPPVSALPVAAAAPLSLAPAPLAAAPLPAAAPAPAPIRLAEIEEAPAKPKPKPRPRPAPKPVNYVKPAPQHTHVAHNDAPRYEAPRYEAPVVQQAPQPSQPNYVGIGAGAVIGGLLGNQIGGGNGKKLATVAGIIGGGMIGNAIQNRTKQD